MRRIIRFVAWTGAVCGALVLFAVVGLRLASRSETVQELVRSRVLAAVRDAVDGDVDLGRVSGVLGRTLVLDDVRIGVGGRTVVRIPRLEIIYHPLALLRGRVRLERLTLRSPWMRAVRDREGWQLPSLRAGDEEEGGGMPVDIDRLEVEEGRLSAALLDADPPRRFGANRVHLEAAARLDAAQTALRVTVLRFIPRGIAVSPLEAAGDLAVASEGAVRVHDLHVSTARTQITAAGAFDHHKQIDARLTLAPLDAGELRAVLPALEVRSDLRATLTAAGPWSAIALRLDGDLGPAGRLKAASRVDLESDPFRHRSHLRFTSLDPGAALDGLPRARLSGGAHAAGHGFGGAAPLRYEVWLGPSEIAGQQLAELDLSGVAENAIHRSRARVVLPAGEALARAQVALGPPLAYRMKSRVQLAHVETLEPTLPGWVAGRMRLAGQGTEAADRRATLRVALTGATLRGVRLTRGEVRAELEGERARIAVAQLEGPGLRAAGSGTLDIGRAVADATVEVTTDLRAFGDALGAPLAGHVSGRATLRGPLASMVVAGQVTADGLAREAVSAKRAGVSFDLRALGGATPGGTIALEAHHVQVGTRPPYEVAAGLEWRHAERVDRVRLDGTVRDEAGASSAVGLTLERTSERIRGQVRTLTITLPEGPTWHLAREATFLVNGGVATEGLTLRAGAQELTLAGRLSSGAQNAATLDAKRVEVAALCRLAAAFDCAGALSAHAALTGTAAAPLLEATITTGDLSIEKVDYGRLAADLRYAERRLALHSILQHARAGELRLDGHVPIDLAWAGPVHDLRDAPVELALRAERLDLTLLRTLAPDELRQTAGRLSLDLRVSGPRDAPQLVGQVALDEGRLELASTGIPYEDIRLRGTASGTTLRVTELSARAGDGTLTGEGTIAVAVGGTSELGVRLHLDDFFAVRRQAYEASLSGDLGVHGNLRAPEVTGRVEVERAIVRPAALPTSGPRIEPDPTIAVINAPETALAPQGPPAPALLDELRLGVDVEIARNAWIRRADANIELGGKLRIEKAPFEPLRITGTIRLLRGWYAFQGRRFELEEGSIIFTGNAPPDPTFDVTATHRTRDYLVKVHVHGTSKEPHLTLSSDPPLEQADVLAVILFGKPTQELGRGESRGLQQNALNLATGYVMPELRTSVMETLGLDALDVELPEGGDQPGRVSVGRYVAGDVFVALAQEFGSRAAEVVSVEYGLTPSISVRGSTTTRGDSAVDVFWRRRY